MIIQIKGITLAIENKVAEEYNVLTIDYTNNWIRRGFIVSPYGATYSE
nr:hypothetical protein [Gudongella oleilytica]